MHARDPERPTKTSWGPGLLVLVASCLLLVAALMLESCTPTKTPEGASEETTKEAPASDRSEAISPADMAQEQQAEPQPEPRPEPTQEKGQPEPDAPAKEGTTTDTEPADAGEPMADTGDGGPGTPCTGIKPPYPDAATTSPPDVDVPENPPADAGCKYKPGQCIGADTPGWKLEDFQPQSCGYQQSYNLTAFRGYVTVVALLSAW